MDNLEIYEKLRSVPKIAQKDIVGGRMKGKTDINPMWRIKALTETFGPCGIGWYYKTTNKWIERYENEIAAFVDIELFVKVENEWSMPICGTGGSSFVTQEKSGAYMSDECYKMATTDAISVSCKQLGVGADIYWGADRSKYSSNEATSDNYADVASTPKSSQQETEYKCEECNKPFTPFKWKEKDYTAKDGYEIAKKKCGGKALCNECKKKAVQ